MYFYDLSKTVKSNSLAEVIAKYSGGKIDFISGLKFKDFNKRLIILLSANLDLPQSISSKK